MTVLTRIEAFAFKARPLHLALALFAVMLLKTGIWAYPSQEMFLQIARNPFVNSFTHPSDHYLFWNWLAPAFAGAVGATDTVSYFLLHLAMSLAFTALFVGLAFRRLPPRQARVAVIFFFVLPVSGTAYFWVGYDSPTLCLMTLALCLHRRVIPVLAVGLALGMQHFEQGAFAAIGVLLATVLTPRLERPATLSFPACLLAGVCTGKLVLLAIFAYHGVEVNSGRLVWLLSHVHSMLANFAGAWFFVIYAIFGTGWLIGAHSLARGRAAVPFCAGLLPILSLLPIVEDSTRVFAITTFPLVAMFWLLDARFLASFTDRHVAVITGVWLVVPWLWAWGGIPQLGAFTYDLRYLLHAATGWPGLPDDLRYWPFHVP